MLISLQRQNRNKYEVVLGRQNVTAAYPKDRLEFKFFFETCLQHYMCEPGVNLINLLQVLFTSVAIVFRLLNNCYTCKLQV